MWVYDVLRKELFFIEKTQGCIPVKLLTRFLVTHVLALVIMSHDVHQMSSYDKYSNNF